MAWRLFVETRAQPPEPSLPLWLGVVFDRLLVAEKLGPRSGHAEATRAAGV